MSNSNRNHYDVLSLSPSSKLSEAEVKQAYHQTLLTYHPDKIKQGLTSRSPPGNPTTSTSIPSVDEIVFAYTILSDQAKRSAYDSTLKARRTSFEAADHLGLETYDLEDLTYTEDSTTGKAAWARTCRCGSETGYLVTEEDLEKLIQLQWHESKSGAMKDILVGCEGCSLLIRVTFAVDAG